MRRGGRREEGEGKEGRRGGEDGKGRECSVKNGLSQTLLYVI